MPTESIIRVLGKNLTIHRLFLREWSEMEGLKQAMDDAISKKDFNEYFSNCIRFIEMASIQSEIKWDEVPWWEFLTAYSEVVKLNTPTIDFPILTSTQKKEDKKLPWEYAGRSWFFWLNLLAGNYGWNEEQIANTDIDTAIGCYQEILIDDQFRKEWDWGLSEIAYPYNASTKTSNFKPLDRPEWMRPIAPKHLPIIKMRKDMMPVGNVVDLSKQ